ncbi:MAG: response regulator [Deltaproteobacteria bacterium]|nr:response regulator [Deltaproteobacteria bacterium]
MAEAMGEKPTPRVIILDDDPLYLRVWEKIFRGMIDCHYCLTNDPATASAVLKSTTVDLVISDIVMPLGSGYAIAELTSKLQSTAQVILTTGYDCNLSRFTLQDPHFHILYKPYRNIGDIQRFVQHLLNRTTMFTDLSEESMSENSDYPQVTEWRL